LAIGDDYASGTVSRPVRAREGAERVEDGSMTWRGPINHRSRCGMSGIGARAEKKHLLVASLSQIDPEPTSVESSRKLPCSRAGIRRALTRFSRCGSASLPCPPVENTKVASPPPRRRRRGAAEYAAAGELAGHEPLQLGRVSEHEQSNNKPGNRQQDASS
jgi:hypothetical protein